MARTDRGAPSVKGTPVAMPPIPVELVTGGVTATVAIGAAIRWFGRRFSSRNRSVSPGLWGALKAFVDGLAKCYQTKVKLSFELEMRRLELPYELEKAKLQQEIDRQALDQGIHGTAPGGSFHYEVSGGINFSNHGDPLDPRTDSGSTSDDTGSSTTPPL